MSTALDLDAVSRAVQSLLDEVKRLKAELAEAHRTIRSHNREFDGVAAGDE